MPVREHGQQSPDNGNDATECPSEEGWDSLVCVPTTSPSPLGWVSLSQVVLEKSG